MSAKTRARASPAVSRLFVEAQLNERRESASNDNFSLAVVLPPRMYQ